MNSLIPLLPDSSFPPSVDGDDCEVVAADLQLHTRFSFGRFEDLIKVVPNVVKKTGHSDTGDFMLCVVSPLGHWWEVTCGLSLLGHKCASGLNQGRRLPGSDVPPQNCV